MYVSEVFVEKVMTEIRRGWGTDLRRGWGVDLTKDQQKDMMSKIKKPPRPSKRKRVVSSPKLAGTGRRDGRGPRRGVR